MSITRWAPQFNPQVQGKLINARIITRADQQDVVDRLTQKVLKGGSGVWGETAMLVSPQITEAEARQLVEWVLLQR